MLQKYHEESIICSYAIVLFISGPAWDRSYNSLFQRIKLEFPRSINIIGAQHWTQTRALWASAFPHSRMLNLWDMSDLLSIIMHITVKLVRGIQALILHTSSSTDAFYTIRWRVTNRRVAKKPDQGAWQSSFWPNCFAGGLYVESPNRDRKSVV